MIEVVVVIVIVCDVVLVMMVVELGTVENAGASRTVEVAVMTLVDATVAVDGCLVMDMVEAVRVTMVITSTVPLMVQATLFAY